MGANGNGAGGGLRHLGRWLLTVALLVAAGAAVYWFWPESPPPSLEELPEPPRFAENPGYVGPRACAECHAARVKECEATRHDHACRRAEDDPLPGFPAEPIRFASRYSAIAFELSRGADGARQTVVRGGRGGESDFPLHVDWIYGAGGRADEVYFTWKGDRLDELALAWLRPTKQWAEQPFDPHQPGDLTRPTTPRCVECHNTWLAHAAGTLNQYRREEALLGVTCEKCHGPGRAHVEHHRAHREDTAPHAIVRPALLSRERQLDVCGQCHSNAIMPRGPAFSYRPGTPLDESFRTLRGEGLEHDHVADQVKYLRRSKCFQKSDTLSCTTCHDPHRPHAARAGARACAGCHRSADCSAQARLPEAVRGECVGCHMPHYNRVAVKFHTTTEQYVFPMRPHEHRVGVYSAARDEVLWTHYRSQNDAASRAEAERLTHALTAHWRAEGDALVKAHRPLAALGALREAVRFDPTPAAAARLKEVTALQAKVDADVIAASGQKRQGRYREAIVLLEGVLKLQPNHATAHGQLGTLYAVVGDRVRAEKHLRAVARYDPDDPYGDNMLGWLAYLRGDGETAVEAYRRADAIQPFTAEIHQRWGLALGQLRRWPEAAERFRAVLHIDPRSAGGCRGLSEALRGQGQFDEAVRYARRAVRLTNDSDAEALLTLCDACVAAGRRAEATEAARRALNAAPAAAPALAAQARRRLDELRPR